VRRIHEAPKKTKGVEKLLRKAASSTSFSELVLGLRELIIDHCASPGHMRQALSLAIHEEEWSTYRIAQGIEPSAPVSEDDEDEPISEEEADYFADDTDEEVE